MQGHLHTSSGIERFVWLSCFFAVYKQQTSPPPPSKTSHNKSQQTATENTTPFIVLNSGVSTADFIHGPISRAPNENIVQNH